MAEFRRFQNVDWRLRPRLARRIGRKSRISSLRVQVASANPRNSGAFSRRPEIAQMAGLAGWGGRIRTRVWRRRSPHRTAFPIAGIEQFHDAEPCQCALASGASLCGCQTAQGQHRMKARAAVITQRSPSPLTDKSDAEAGVGSQVFWRPAQAQAARGRPSTRPG